jgi:uncharacterized damage-inducible protein DinB
MADREYPRIDIVRHWRTTNNHLIGLVDLIPEDKYHWSPREGEWDFQMVLSHLNIARYFGPIIEGLDHGALLSEAVRGSQTKEGMKEELAKSWDVLAEFLADQRRLDAVYENTADDYANEPEKYDGHYIAYHRLAHDLHHRGTVIDYLGQLGVSLKGNWIRPL